MPAAKQTIMTIWQRIRGQSLAWVTLLLAASLPGQSLAEPVPGQSLAEPVLSVADGLFAEPAGVQAFRAYYPVTLEQFVDPGIASDAVSARRMAEPAANDLLHRLQNGFSLEPAARNDSCLTSLMK